MGFGSFDFFWGSFGAAFRLAGPVPAVFGVDGGFSDEFAGGGVDDAFVELVDEDDAGSVEVSAEPDVVQKMANRDDFRWPQPRTSKWPLTCGCPRRLRLGAPSR